METLRAKTDRWLNLVGNDGRTKARLNLDTGELVIKLRGECNKWPLRDLLNCTPVQDADTGGVLQNL